MVLVRFPYNKTLDVVGLCFCLFVVCFLFVLFVVFIVGYRLLCGL